MSVYLDTSVRVVLVLLLVGQTMGVKTIFVSAYSIYLPLPIGIVYQFLYHSSMHQRIADKETTQEIGEEFCTNPIIKKISFTGSTAIGKHLMKMSSGTVKRLSLGKYMCAMMTRVV